MSIIRNGHSRSYQCDQCGTIGQWGKGWSHYGSFIMSEEDPDELIISCSEKCKDALQAKLKSGAIKLPEYSIRGYTVKKTKEKVGY